MLKITSVTKTYKSKGGQICHALNDISMQFPDTGMVFILGKSGSGKTTLLNILGGLDRPDCGTIELDGIDIESMTKEEMDYYRCGNIGFVFQDFQLIEGFSLRKNIAIARELQNSPVTNSEIDEILNRVGLFDMDERITHEISGGQKQRCALARALIKQPRIILADEPTGSLDSETGVEIMRLLKEVSKDTLVIVVSHDEMGAKRYGDRIIRLKDGEIEGEFDGGGGEVAYLFASDKPSKEEINGYLAKGINVNIKVDNIANKNDDKQNIANQDNAKQNIANKIQPKDQKSQIQPRQIQPKDQKSQIQPKDQPKDQSQDKSSQLFLKKSKLSIKIISKLSFRSMKLNIKRLLMSTILTILAVAMIGFSSSVTSYDYVKEIAQFFQQEGNGNMAFGVQYYLNESGTKRREAGIYTYGLEHLSTITTDFLPVRYVAGVIKPSSGPRPLHLKNFGADFLSNGSDQVVEATPETYLRYDYKLLCGRYPQNINEIMITDLTVFTYMVCGYKYNDVIYPILSAEDLLNKPIESSIGDLRIVGVLDFNTARYDVLKTKTENEVRADYLSLFIEFSERKQAFYGVTYGYTGLYRTLLDAYPESQSLAAYLDTTSENFKSTESVDTVSLEYNPDLAFASNTPITKLEKNQILVSRRLITEIFCPDIDDFRSDLDYWNEIAKTYNIYGQKLRLRFSNIYRYTNSPFEQPEYNDYEIVGIMPNTYGNVVCFSKEALDEVPDNYSRAVVFPFTSVEDASNLIRKLNESPYRVNNATFVFSASQIAARSCISVSDSLEMFQTTFLALTALFMVLSIVLLYGFFSLSVGARKRDIGVLKSLGVSNKNIRAILYFECALLLIISLPIAGVLSYWCNIVLNNYILADNVFITKYLMPFRFIDGFYMVVAGLVGAVLALTLPLLRLTNNKISENIRTRDYV